MKKCFYSLTIIYLFLSCGKKVDSFEPTTNLKNLLKNEKLNQNYTELRKENVYLSSRMDTTKSFKKFIANTSIEDLISLTECEKPTVRCFAFRALVEKKYPEIKKILFRHQYDKENVEEFQGVCIKIITPVKFYMLETLRPYASYKNKDFIELEKTFKEQ